VRKLFWQMMVTLDGFSAGSAGELDWHVMDDEFDAYVMEMLNSIDAFLLGRVTYQMFEGYWPTAPNREAGLMNALPKLVFSKTLRQAHWQHSTLLNAVVPAEIEKLKAQPGKDLALFGSASLASTFMRLGLIDEVRILVNPVVLGGGKPTFSACTARLPFKLLKSQTLRSGVVILYYQPQLGGMAQTS